MKTKLFQILAVFSTLALLASSAQAIRAINDFRTPGSIENAVVEKMVEDVTALSESEARQQREEEVRQIQELLRLDELNRENTMREALRQEGLEDRVKGREDLELAMEERNVDMHMGKVLTDVHGNRVRMEEYVLRPADDQVQFLNLTMRSDRLDYIDYRAYFNTTVPENTHGLWRKEFGQHAPNVYLVTETIEYSNMTDAVNYGVGFFEPTWVTEAQQYILPERENTLRVNDILKWGQSRPTASVDFTEMPEAVGIQDADLTYTDGNFLAPKLTYYFNDGTYLAHQKFLINEDGEVYSLSNLEDLIKILTNFNEFIFNAYQEIIWTASEFGERDIDTVSQFQRLVNVFADDDRGLR